ncbi:MAG: hypothetical protein A3I11_06200 [Elusimicrobia bacterium RIFCSPLOWO2_02_FULL_39_32]|nr:MAG: hypothetical protein A2034_02670 [Elusimicrobia bacterium GWA2_38_7]OGR80955.1 MAG: hypothetical protein A3B80_04735 [Elusimicrobia bacterium RIFCSPHIGHO2_02_FULL_39_36]OGR91662.1 MAG: hypothetical protein A3I11_06200 [Elusimicrobia bacterium RIFCSPLOWO2_02_FULL_39_32]OGS00914.1 MAG: hypothetical protein A3G85_00330 [Elusimicrobia bacterium RIFCSPLOWO2_12_FULL_39_28]
MVKMNQDKENLKKVLSFWMGSYICVAAVLFFLFRVRLLPLILAGILTLTLTLLKYKFFSKNSD